jgi:hypothetical protein
MGTLGRPLGYIGLRLGIDISIRVSIGMGIGAEGDTSATGVHLGYSWVLLGYPSGTPEKIL